MTVSTITLSEECSACHGLYERSFPEGEPSRPFIIIVHQITHAQQEIAEHAIVALRTHGPLPQTHLPTAEAAFGFMSKTHLRFDCSATLRLIFSFLAPMKISSAIVLEAAEVIMSNSARLSWKEIS